jgi:cell wall-associated NlpC family hydrolase
MLIAMNSFIRLYFLLFAFVLGSCGSTKKTPVYTGGEIVLGASEAPALPATASPEKYDSLRVKYARYLNSAPDKITNIQLYKVIDYWLYTPYKWGGTTKSGIDCSAFIQRLLEDAYSIYIPRTSIDQFFAKWIDRFGSAQHLSEGDLVFFRTMDDKIVSHVGMYLGNGMFVNSSSSKGVSIASLNDPYWKKRYVAAGRVKQGHQAVNK